jgi:hypothetical protein
MSDGTTQSVCQRATLSLIVSVAHKGAVAVTLGPKELAVFNSSYR